MKPEDKKVWGSRQGRELQMRLRRELDPTCYLCSEPIDLNAKPRTPRSYSLDHVSPLDEGKFHPLDESNIRPAHYSCNARKNNSNLPQAGEAVTSRKWA